MKSKYRTLAAISWAAHEKGLSYGQFVSRPDFVDITKIVKDYAAHKRMEAEEKDKASETPKAKPLRPVFSGRPALLPIKEAERLYDLGYNDAQIGEKLGFKPITICHWRRRTGRAANARQGWNQKNGRCVNG